MRVILVDLEFPCIRQNLLGFCFPYLCVVIIINIPLFQSEEQDFMAICPDARLLYNNNMLIRKFVNIVHQGSRNLMILNKLSRTHLMRKKITYCVPIVYVWLLEAMYLKSNVYSPLAIDYSVSCTLNLSEMQFKSENFTCSDIFLMKLAINRGTWNFYM